MHLTLFLKTNLSADKYSAMHHFSNRRASPFRFLAAHFAWASILILNSVAPGADFNVDMPTWGTATEVGTLSWAIDQANTTPGVDNINIQVDLEIDVDNGSTLVGEETWLTRITESLVINGNGATLVGNPSYVRDEVAATKTNIIGSAYSYPFTRNDVVTVPGVSFAQIGDRNTDNSLIEVEISDLNADGLASIALAHDGSKLTVSDGNFVNMVNYSGALAGRSTFEAKSDSVLNLSNVSIKRAFPFGSVLDVLPDASVYFGTISGANSQLNLENSYISDSFGAGAISWEGGVANVVSTVLDSSGGIAISDSTKDGVLNIVNSLLYMVDGETLSQTNRIQALLGGEANIRASSILYDAFYTDGTNDSAFPFGSHGMPLTATKGGLLNVESSVVLPLNWEINFEDSQPYSEFSSGNLMADDYSYIGATDSQDSAAVKAIFDNMNILTVGPAYDLLDIGGVKQFDALPQGAFPSSNSVLLERIQDAGLGGMNELINPIDGTAILFDVYGNARTRNGTRDLGAVQATVPEPSTALMFSALAAWSLMSSSRRFRKTAPRETF